MNTLKQRTALAILFAVAAAGVLIFTSYFSARTHLASPPAQANLPATAQADTVASIPDAAPAAPEPESQTKTAVATEVPLAIPTQPAKGNLNAPVTIVEFADFYCPYCARHVRETIPLIETDYIDTGLVRYEFRNLIIHGQPALLAAVAGECAHQQGAFWGFHDAVFERIFGDGNRSDSRHLEADDLKQIATQLGLNCAAFDACLDTYEQTYNKCHDSYQTCGQDTACAEQFQGCLENDPMVAKVFEDQASLSTLIEQLPEAEKAQAQRIGTPAFFINGHILIGAHPYAVFKEMIDTQLAKARTQR